MPGQALPGTASVSSRTFFKAPHNFQKRRTKTNWRLLCLVVAVGGEHKHPSEGP